MITTRLVSPKKIVIEEVDKPKPQKGEVLIKVEYCGICGSDVHAYLGRHPFVTLPIIQGHEFSGIISDAGGIKKFKVGQRVTVEPSLVCGKCRNCTSGRYNICDELRVMGFQSIGAFAEYITVPASKVFVLPDEVSMDEGALIEPAAVGVHAAKRVHLKNKNALVIGAGTIGLMTMQAVKVSGAKVMIADLLDYRLEKAKELGAEVVVNAAKENLTSAAKNFGADVIFECVGSESTARQAVEAARKGAEIVIVGVFAKEVMFPVHLVQNRELEIVGSLMYTKEDYSDAIKLVKERRMKVRDIVTHILPLKELDRAYSILMDEKSRALKVLIKIV